ncbi:MAG: PilZ domain-containing protein [Nitrospirae bacterium]|nr:PilZ domain-containing protein [Nitrospirota bacterium]
MVDDGAQKERRERTRVRTGLDARVQSGGLVVRGRVRDLSLKGVYLLCRPRVHEGADCRVTLVLTGADTPVPLEVDGRVVYTDDGGMAIEFTEMPADSLYHLRNLVLYNSQDTERVERELQQPPIFRRRNPSGI